MIRILSILLTVLFVCLPAFGEADHSATLRFSSFAGGGYEYTVEIEDPSIVQADARYEYEESDEPIDGASFDFIVTLTGLKPGSTKAVVYGRSPIIENEDSVYTVIVDDVLNVTVTPVRTISTLYTSRMIEGGFACYEIAMDENGYHVSVDEGPDRPISTEAIDEIMSVIDDYDVASWDGFSESDYNVLDGENFVLRIGFADGTSVTARGDNAFPVDYDVAMNEIWRILNWNTDDESEME